MSGSITRALGAFVSGLRPEAIPAEAASVARTGFVDCVGVMIAGRDEPVVGILRDTLGVAGPKGEAALTFGPLRAPAPEAAWINGTAAHALDYDDVALRGHPSTVLVPAILAEGEALGATGAEMVAAYVAGYEVWAELTAHDQDYHHEKGWHPTGVFGAVGAAAACARLRGLDADTAAQAIALGASQSAGLGANFGTMTKPFHAGRSAHAGVMAARLAGAGMTASLDAIEHPRGFLYAISPRGRTLNLDGPNPGFGSEFRILEHGLSIKKFPICYCGHRATDAMLALVARRPIRAEDVEAIEVVISRAHAAVLRNALPQTGLEAKFSAQFDMACALIAGKVGLVELSDGFVQRPDVQALMRRVTVIPTDEADPNLPGYAPADVVRVRLRSGEQIEESVRRARGHATLPLSDAELRAKFMDCLAAAGEGARAEALFERLNGIASLGAAKELARAA
ncbi:MmgE/PrpD family protein [Roseomonas sp. SSH11]|uniref:MmgE/PrpD family protein n=1 Tax=Pararoseomonas baculiformis TaxID=2820812 RepID=A0ABS4A960_9PROT|nr:MmgE/PrpD family protein [Pararoseomonas baculiformis]MBP0443517.1 MmgE/PrpD family protein [Pararoseomonas baculiformis]